MNKRPLLTRPVPAEEPDERTEALLSILRDDIFLRRATMEELEASSFSQIASLPSSLEEYMRVFEKSEYFMGLLQGVPFFIGELVTSLLANGESIFLRGFSTEPGDCRLTIEMFPSDQPATDHYLAFVALTSYVVAKMKVNRIVVPLRRDEHETLKLLEWMGFTSIKLEDPLEKTEWACYLDVKEYCGQVDYIVGKDASGPDDPVQDKYLLP